MEKIFTEKATIIALEATRKKELIEVNRLKRVYNRTGKNTSFLLDWQIITTKILSIFGFVSYSKMSELRCDLDIQETCLKVFVEKSKTYIHIDRHWLFPEQK